METPFAQDFGDPFGLGLRERLYNLESAPTATEELRTVTKTRGVSVVIEHWHASTPIWIVASSEFALHLESS